MDTALYLKNNKPVSANQLQQMKSSERNKYRGHLVCEECGVKAFFRKKTKDGKRPCFSSKHRHNCSMKNSRPSHGDEANKATVNKKQSDENIFKIRFTDYFKDLYKLGDNDLIEPFEIYGKSRNKYEKDPSKKVYKHLTLPLILHYATTGILVDQNIYILKNKQSVHISKLTHKFDNIKQTFKGKLGLFWGFLRSTNNDIWLNTDLDSPYINFSIKLNDNVKDVFWNKMGKRYGKWKIDIPAIVFGLLNFSNHGKPYIEVDDISNFYLNKRLYNKMLNS